MVRLVSIALLLALVGAISIAQPKTIRVPQDHATIQAAIDAAVNGDTVLVAEGTYHVNLLLRKKITLGSLFILDGDTSHVSKTILDGGTPAVTDSASVIRIDTGTDSTTAVIGFTIQHGQGTINVEPYDGSLWKTGGGIQIIKGGARISHNIIENNAVSTSTRGAAGGGISTNSNLGLTYWIIEHNQIRNNSVIYTGAFSGQGAAGGGLWLTEDGRFDHNVVSGNTVSGSTGSSGGGIEWGAAIGSGVSSLTISRNFIHNNVASVGAGILIYAMPTVVDYPVCMFVNNIIANNRSTTGTGAIRVISGRFSLVNNTISGNTGSQSIRLENTRGELKFNMLNNIVWNPGATAEFSGGALAAGNYNLVRGGMSGTGNLAVDPKFALGDSLYRLSSVSPAMGKGVMSSLVGGITLNAPSSDYLGTPRPLPGLTNPDLGAIEETTTGIEDEEGAPRAFALEQNYPNPFNPETQIGYRIKETGAVRLAVYDLLGREVAVLVDEEKEAGYYKAVFSSQSSVDRLPSGVYFYKLEARNAKGETWKQTRKMVLLK